MLESQPSKPLTIPLVSDVASNIKASIESVLVCKGQVSSEVTKMPKISLYLLKTGPPPIT